jgi:hypothetical protein
VLSSAVAESHGTIKASHCVLRSQQHNHDRLATHIRFCSVLPNHRTDLAFDTPKQNYPYTIRLHVQDSLQIHGTLGGGLINTRSASSYPETNSSSRLDAGLYSKRPSALYRHDYLIKLAKNQEHHERRNDIPSGLPIFVPLLLLRRVLLLQDLHSPL